MKYIYLFAFLFLLSLNYVSGANLYIYPQPNATIVAPARLVGCTDAYQCVDDPVGANDGLTTYISTLNQTGATTTTSLFNTSFNFTPYVGTTIKEVWFYTRCGESSIQLASTVSINMSNGSAWETSVVNAPPPFGSWSNTGYNSTLTYSWNTLNQIKFGVNMYKAGTLLVNWVGCTQIYLNITYEDNIPPQVVINTPLNTTYDYNNILINVTATDYAIDKCRYSINNWATNYSLTLSGTNWISNLTCGTVDGSYRIKIACNDTSGNLNMTEYKDFTIVNAPPSITMSTPINTTYTGFMLAGTIEASDNSTDSSCNLGVSSCWSSWDGTYWWHNSNINNSLPNIGADKAPNVFYKDGYWYMIAGNYDGYFKGFVYNGTDWIANSTINASLPVIIYDTHPSTFYKDGFWYMIAGSSQGKFDGFVYNGTDWNINSTINSSLPDIGGWSSPYVFYKDSSWYMISGSEVGTFNGFVYNGTDWLVNSSINASLPDIGYKSNPNVFYKDNYWYLISGADAGTFTGFVYNGTDWKSNSTIVTNLPDIGTYSNPSIFYKDNFWYMIVGTENQFPSFVYSYEGTVWTTNITFIHTPPGGITWSNDEYSIPRGSYRYKVACNDTLGKVNSSVYMDFSMNSCVAPTFILSTIKNWNIECSDNCSVDNEQYITSDNNVTVSGTGVFNIWDWISFSGTKQYFTVNKGCELRIWNRFGNVGGVGIR